MFALALEAQQHGAASSAPPRTSCLHRRQGGRAPRRAGTQRAPALRARHRGGHDHARSSDRVQSDLRAHAGATATRSGDHLPRRERGHRRDRRPRRSPSCPAWRRRRLLRRRRLRDLPLHEDELPRRALRRSLERAGRATTSPPFHPRKYASRIDGRTAADLGGEPILAMRHLTQHSRLPPAFVRTVLHAQPQSSSAGATGPRKPPAAS